MAPEEVERLRRLLREAAEQAGHYASECTTREDPLAKVVGYPRRGGSVWLVLRGLSSVLCADGYVRLRGPEARIRAAIDDLIEKYDWALYRERWIAPLLLREKDLLNAYGYAFREAEWVYAHVHNLSTSLHVVTPAQAAVWYAWFDEYEAQHPLLEAA